jgi:hypothetical protein
MSNSMPNDKSSPLVCGHYVMRIEKFEILDGGRVLLRQQNSWFISGFDRALTIRQGDSGSGV